MSYIRPGPLAWFEGSTAAYVWPDAHGTIHDYGDLEGLSDEEFCELVGLIVKHCFVVEARDPIPAEMVGGGAPIQSEPDMAFVRRVVRDLARRTGCADRLRADPPRRGDPRDGRRARAGVHVSYMRIGHSLRWFEGETDAYIYPEMDGRIQDYGDLEAMADPSFCELVGRFAGRTVREHGAYDDDRVGTVGEGFALEIVTDLARRTGCADRQRPDSRREPGPALRGLDDDALAAVVGDLLERYLTLDTAGPRTYDSHSRGEVVVQAEPDTGFVRRVTASLARRLAREAGRG